MLRSFPRLYKLISSAQLLKKVSVKNTELFVNRLTKRDPSMERQHVLFSLSKIYIYLH